MSRVSFRLYLITDRRWMADAGGVEVAVERAIRSLPQGSVAIQVREKDLRSRDLLDLVRRVCAVCGPHRVPVLVNDRLDVALAARADGVHLPASGFPPAEVRRVLPAGLIGISTHSVAELQRLDPAAVDFATFGPVFDTPSKRPYGPPQGVPALASAVASSPVPVFAIGGIGPLTAEKLRGTGVAGIAMISAAWTALDPRGTLRNLLRDVFGPTGSADPSDPA